MIPWSDSRTSRVVALPRSRRLQGPFILVFGPDGFVRQGNSLEHLGRPGHGIQGEILCAVPTSGFGNIGFLLEPWFMDHCSKNLTLPSLWDGHVVHIAVSYFYGIVAPRKGSGGLGSGDSHL